MIKHSTPTTTRLLVLAALLLLPSPGSAQTPGQQSSPDAIPSAGTEDVQGDRSQQLDRATPPVHFQFLLGIGLPELIHAQMGYFLLDRLSLELRYGNVIFNHMVGLGATGHLLADNEPGRPPRHGLLVSAHAMINPTVEFSINSGGERLNTALLLAAGYGFQSDIGFCMRATLGALLSLENNSVGGGPAFSLSAGWSL